MQWTKCPPEREGWYWVRILRDAGRRPESAVVEVCRDPAYPSPGGWFFLLDGASYSVTDARVLDWSDAPVESPRGDVRPRRRPAGVRAKDAKDRKERKEGEGPALRVFPCPPRHEQRQAEEPQ